MDKAGDILKNLAIFNNINQDKAHDYSKLFNSWESIIGKKIAGYSRIKDLDRNSLIIEADHPGIIQLLQFNYKIALEKLNRNYPQLEISDIRILLKSTNNVNYHKKSNLISDMSEENVNNKEDYNLERIENKNFKELLLNMKKRSQL